MHLLYRILIIASCILVLVFTNVHSHGMDDDDDDGDDDASGLKFKNELAQQKLLVISLDGFRHDFLEINGTKTLNILASNGVRARSLTSSYITKTFPNHHSIATGLYEEVHGIVANTMWDPEWNSTFHSCSDISCGPWYGGEPIWNSNELYNDQVEGHHRSRRHGSSTHKPKPIPKASGVIYWPGSSANMNDMPITHVEKYVDPYANDSSYMNLRQRFDKVMTWFTDSRRPVNLAMVYYEFPDKLCHKFGPESIQVNSSIREIDSDINYLLDLLKKNNLSDSMNILVVSDHGFADIDGYLYLDDCIKNISEYQVISNSPIMSIWPKDERDVDYLYNTLKNCEGYVVHRNPSPELQKYHYSDNRRIAPIIVSSQYSRTSAKLIYKDKSETWTNKGSHGWNSTWEKMHALFIAHGPAFKKGLIHPPFDNVNIYPLMCTVLGIDCPPSNGTLDMVKDMLLLEEAPSYDMTTTATVAAVALVCALVSGVMVIGACKLANSRHRNKRLANGRTYVLEPPKSLTAERSTLLETSDEEF